MNITQEMKDYYYQRTKRHIDLVRKYCIEIVKKYPVTFIELLKRADLHDLSKYEEPELTPYIYISWSYKCKREGKEFVVPENIKEMMNVATHHHVTTNSHHPEYYDSNELQLINRDDRDKPPTRMVDATRMPDIDIAEMCADWAGMGEELGNSPVEWAKKNVNIRWKFNDHQEHLIYSILSNLGYQ